MQTGNNAIVVFLIASTAIILFLATLVITMLYFYLKKQILYKQKIDALKTDHEKKLLTTQIEIQEDTFQQISREIHDNINLSLTFAKLNLNTVDWKNIPRATQLIDTSLQVISKAIIDLSDISRSMDSELIASQGLIESLEKEISNIRSMDLFSLDFIVSGSPVFMDSQKELVIFRIIQEAFNNIIKHAKAAWVALKLYYHDDQIEILIYDDGKGFSKAAVEHPENKVPRAGLRNMQKRAAIFNGKTIIDSEPGSGTCIFVTIPYK